MSGLHKCTKSLWHKDAPTKCGDRDRQSQSIGGETAAQESNCNCRQVWTTVADERNDNKGASVVSYCCYRALPQAAMMCCRRCCHCLSKGTAELALRPVVVGRLIRPNALWNSNVHQGMHVEDIRTQERSIGKNCDLKITLLDIQQPDPTLVGVNKR